ENRLHATGFQLLKKREERSVASVPLKGWLVDVQRLTVVAKQLVDKIDKLLRSDVIGSTNDKALSPGRPERLHNIGKDLLVFRPGASLLPLEGPVASLPCQSQGDTGQGTPAFSRRHRDPQVGVGPRDGKPAFQLDVP